MYLSFDSETLGLPYENLPLLHVDQPRVIQLGCILFDEFGVEHEVMDTLLTPDGWEVDYDSGLIHGWTTEDCEFMGQSGKDVLNAFMAMASKAEMVVAHHVDFDLKMLEIEAAFAGMSICGLPESFCTMKASSPVAKLPYYRGQYKYPSLQEAIRAVLGKDVEEDDLHDALVDARYCKDIFLKLREDGHIFR